jgi:hypothetical protein
MRSPHDININNGELLDDWIKHNKSKEAPVPKGTKVMVETWTPQTHITYFAEDINWREVKWFKVVEPKK